MGFAPFGTVVEGMDVVDKIFPGYRESPRQDLITDQGDAYLKANFPKIDKIKLARILPAVPPATHALQRAPKFGTSAVRGQSLYGVSVNASVCLAHLGRALNLVPVERLAVDGALQRLEEDDGKELPVGEALQPDVEEQPAVALVGGVFALQRERDGEVTKSMSRKAPK
jgi:hypothetical protein